MKTEYFLTWGEPSWSVNKRKISLYYTYEIHLIPQVLSMGSIPILLYNRGCCSGSKRTPKQVSYGINQRLNKISLISQNWITSLVRFQILPIIGKKRLMVRQPLCRGQHLIWIYWENKKIIFLYPKFGKLNTHWWLFIATLSLSILTI